MSALFAAKKVSLIAQHGAAAPELHESYVRSALDYVRLAEQASGPLSLSVDLAYVWGAALDEVGWRQSDVRIIDLDSSITRSDDFAPEGINYRMSPENSGCLARAGINCCVLANNHVLDWVRSGSTQTSSAPAAGGREIGRDLSKQWTAFLQ